MSVEKAFWAEAVLLQCRVRAGKQAREASASSLARRSNKISKHDVCVVQDCVAYDSVAFCIATAFVA